MDDPLLVRGRQAPRDLRRVVHELAQRKGSVRQPLPERLAFQQLEDDERDLALQADVVDGENVGVVEGADGASLVREAAQSLITLRYPDFQAACKGASMARITRGPERAPT